MLQYFDMVFCLVTLFKITIVHIQVLSLQMQARDLPKIIQAAYHLIPYFIFSPEESKYSETLQLQI